jgi:hypothetical protein
MYGKKVIYVQKMHKLNINDTKYKMRKRVHSNKQEFLHVRSLRLVSFTRLHRVYLSRYKYNVQPIALRASHRVRQYKSCYCISFDTTMKSVLNKSCIS